MGRVSERVKAAGYWGGVRSARIGISSHLEKIPRRFRGFWGNAGILSVVPVFHVSVILSVAGTEKPKQVHQPAFSEPSIQTAVGEP